MSFNPDPYKQAVEVHFSRKINPVDTLSIHFNNLAIAVCETRKYLGLLLDKRLAFDRYAEETIQKANNIIGLITRFNYLQGFY